MKLNKLYWYANRLKAMSIPEIKHRLEKNLTMYKQSKKYTQDIYINDINKINKSELIKFEEKLVHIFNYKYIDIINYKITEEIDVFGEKIKIDEKINWHKSNFSNWDKEIYSNYINFKDTDDIGEIRYTWEINRHLFFVKLALNFKKTNDKKYIDLLKMHFYDWIKNNPFLKGVNWASPMEIAIRSYQWTITYSIIKDDIDTKFKLDLINSIVNSIEYVRNNYSLYSSANNHLIVEAVYCGIIGYIIDPIYKNNYLEESFNIIEREILLQNNKDGVNKEQATHYQAFVLDSFFQFAFFLQKIDKEFPYKEILFNMSEFIGLLRQSGKVIEFGDSDDAKLISFNLHTDYYYDYVLQLASTYFNTKFIDIENMFEEVKFISQKCRLECHKHEYKNFYIYEAGGYAIFNLESDFMLFDIGELGFGSIAAHGHSDALSIVYCKDNKPIFVDPGTYIYNIKSKWRDYFRQTSSHNTLVFENKNQSLIKGPFLWGRKASVEIIDYGENKDIIYICARHDGYLPRVHQRNIMYLKDESTFIIKDIFKDTAEINYILDDSLYIEKISDNELKVNNIENNLFITFNGEFEITSKYISKRFLSKSITSGLKVINDFNKNNSLYTIISDEKINVNKDTISFKSYDIEYISYKEIRRKYDRNC